MNKSEHSPEDEDEDLASAIGGFIDELKFRAECAEAAYKRADQTVRTTSELWRLDCERLESELQSATEAILKAMAERNILQNAIEEIIRRSELLLQQNMGRCNTDIEHDKRSYGVTLGNIDIGRVALQQISNQ